MTETPPPPAVDAAKLAQLLISLLVCIAVALGVQWARTHSPWAWLRPKPYVPPVTSCPAGQDVVYDAKTGRGVSCAVPDPNAIFLDCSKGMAHCERKPNPAAIREVIHYDAQGRRLADPLGIR